MRTILVLDSQSTIPAHKALDILPVIVIATVSLAKAEVCLARFAPVIWICDLSVLDGDIADRLPRIRNAHPRLRVLLTGPPTLRPAAEILIENGLANAFLPKPWPLITLRNMVARTLAALDPEPAEDPSGSTSDADAEPPATGYIENPDADDPLRYRLNRLLGQGGTGRVYHATDQLLEMDIAIKVLHPELVEDADALTALKAEARVTMGLSHRHIVRLYNMARRGQQLLLIMEYVRGENLQQLLVQTPRFPPESVVRVATVSTAALGYAHRHGVLHNDLKPSNIMLSEDGVLKLIDFGVATLIGQPRKSDYIHGTPAYMSPEQIRGEALDPRTDLYALGMILYQLLAGRLPHPAEADFEHIAQHGSGPLTGVPGRVRTVLEQATALQREQRWPTITAFHNAFEAACRDEWPDLYPEKESPA